jgi:hypothetical protein
MPVVNTALAQALAERAEGFAAEDPPVLEHQHRGHATTFRLLRDAARPTRVAATVAGSRMPS